MGKWFSNYGQIIQIVIQFLALCVGIRVGLPDLWAQGVEGFKVYWPVLAFPTGAGLFFLFFDRVIFNMVLGPILDGISRRSFEKRFPEFRDPPGDG